MALAGAHVSGGRKEMLQQLRDAIAADDKAHERNDPTGVALAMVIADIACAGVEALWVIAHELQDLNAKIPQVVVERITTPPAEPAT